MAYQTIIDNATAISIDKNPIISATLTRDQTVRQTSRGGAIYRFSVTPSPGMKWAEYRNLIAALEEKKIGSETIGISNPKHNWISGYAGSLNSAQVDALTFSYTTAQQGSNTRQVIVGTLPSVDASTIVFRAGDLIQSANSVFPYTVTSDVTRGGSSTIQVPIHRVCLDTPSASTYDLKVGQEVTWRVVMTRMPRWTINSDRTITWDGNFEFTESLI